MKLKMTISWEETLSDDEKKELQKVIEVGEFNTFKNSAKVDLRKGVLNHFSRRAENLKVEIDEVRN